MKKDPAYRTVHKVIFLLIFVLSQCVHAEKFCPFERTRNKKGFTVGF